MPLVVHVTYQFSPGTYRLVLLLPMILLIIKWFQCVGLLVRFVCVVLTVRPSEKTMNDGSVGAVGKELMPAPRRSL